MARIRCNAHKSVIPILPSRLAECPLRRTVPGQSSHLERLHACTRSKSADARRRSRTRSRSSRTLPPRLSRRWSLGGSLPLHLSQRCPPHHHRASRLLEESLTEMETTTPPVAVRATTWSSQRSRSWRDGSLDPSLVTLLTGVTSTTLLTPCCIGPSTDTLGPSSTIV
jgi:hypothetical protein